MGTLALLTVMLGKAGIIVAFGPTPKDVTHIQVIQWIVAHFVHTYTNCIDSVVRHNTIICLIFSAF